MVTYCRQGLPVPISLTSLSQLKDLLAIIELSHPVVALHVREQANNLISQIKFSFYPWSGPGLVVSLYPGYSVPCRGEAEKVLKR